MNHEHEDQPLLAPHREEALSAQAAEQLAKALADPTAPAHTGEDLPKADRAALLRKARQ